MKLGPETRRQVGDNYEQIIFQLLKDFGWKSVRENFEAETSKEFRKSGQQGGDGSYLYFDPLLNYNVGVYVESKKIKNLQSLKTKLSEWLKAIDNMVRNLDTKMFSFPFKESGGDEFVRVQTGLLSVWVDEDYTDEEFKEIFKREISNLQASISSLDDFALITAFSNRRILQLQAVVTQLWQLIGRNDLSGQYLFEYLTRGPNDSPNILMLSSDYIFIRAMKVDNSGYQLIAFHLGESSKQQIKHFSSYTINILGQIMSTAQGFHTFIWDFPPSNPEKQGLWQSLYKAEIERVFKLPHNFITLQGFNPEYPSMTD